MSGEGLFKRLSAQINEAEGTPSESPFTMAELLDLPDIEIKIARTVMRAEQPMSVEDLAAALDIATPAVVAAVGSLSLRGLVETADGVVRMASVRRSRRIEPGGIFGRLGDLD